MMVVQVFRPSREACTGYEHFPEYMAPAVLQPVSTGKIRILVDGVSKVSLEDHM